MIRDNKQQEHTAFSSAKEWDPNDNAKYFNFDGGPVKRNIVSRWACRMVACPEFEKIGGAFSSVSKLLHGFPPVCAGARFLYVGSIALGNGGL